METDGISQVGRPKTLTSHDAVQKQKHMDKKKGGTSGYKPDHDERSWRPTSCSWKGWKRGRKGLPRSRKQRGKQDARNAHSWKAGSYNQASGDANITSGQWQTPTG